ncbi:MAG: hypothetical protein HOY71_16715 [Nonomuraea sp.]|nr:hypothetical protein [Nonomuraea sp.]
MRAIRKIAVVSSVLAGAVVAAGLPASAASAPAFVAYHGVSASEQTAKFTQLRAQGYRPISVNVSDGGRYAAVWIKGGSSAWSLYQGMSAAGFQKRFDQQLKAGLQPVDISVTGSGDSAVYAAIFEKKGTRFEARSALTPDAFAAANQRAVGQGLALTSVDVYGTPDAPRYAAVWSANTGGAWYYTYGKSSAQHQAEFDARVKKGYRPVDVAVGPDGTYTAVWRKDGLKSWASYVEMDAAGYQKRFDQLKAKGLYPVEVNAENGKYAAVFQ